MCALEKAGATAAKDPSCVSGPATPGGGSLPCRPDADGDMDCAYNGKCNDGTCACSGDFSGPSCGTVPESHGGCNLQVRERARRRRKRRRRSRKS
eukprot:SAG22_NODE_541_length_9297_cov_9.387149_5_plen_95_part_00